MADDHGGWDLDCQNGGRLAGERRAEPINQSTCRYSATTRMRRVPKIKLHPLDFEAAHFIVTFSRILRNENPFASPDPSFPFAAPLVRAKGYTENQYRQGRHTVSQMVARLSLGMNAS